MNDSDPAKKDLPEGEGDESLGSRYAGVMSAIFLYLRSLVCV